MENHMVSLQRDLSQQLGGKNMSEQQPLGQCYYNTNNLLHQYTRFKTGHLHYCI